MVRYNCNFRITINDVIILKEEKEWKECTVVVLMSIEVLDRRQFDDYRLTYINVIDVWINDAPFSSIF